MDYLSVVGTRPQLMKLKPVITAFGAANLEHGYIDTGQHYDTSLHDIHLVDLSLPKPIYNLQVREFSQSNQIANMIQSIDNCVSELKPKCILVYGDTNSTLAATLVAIKRGILVGHVESGLRSGNMKMSEEQNRIMVDHVSSILFAPTKNALRNLHAEGLQPRANFVGDVMYDLLKTYELKVSNNSHSVQDYYVLTMHRAENVDNPNRLIQILNALDLWGQKILLYAHPRLEKRILEFKLQLPRNLDLREPIAHSEMYTVLLNSRGLITDSGGLQKEAFLMGVQCATLRSETEWPETLIGGWNSLVKDFSNLSLVFESQPTERDTSLFGDGNAATKIVDLIRRLS
jgi:UDP-N-acetylglucosamine 2-epimerase (non-hydrolysing)